MLSSVQFPPRVQPQVGFQASLKTPKNIPVQTAMNLLFDYRNQLDNYNLKKIQQLSLKEEIFNLGNSLFTSSFGYRA